MAESTHISHQPMNTSAQDIVHGSDDRSVPEVDGQYLLMSAAAARHAASSAAALGRSIAAVALSLVPAQSSSSAVQPFCLIQTSHSSLAMGWICDMKPSKHLNMQFVSANAHWTSSSKQPWQFGVRPV